MPVHFDLYRGFNVANPYAVSGPGIDCDLQAEIRHHVRHGRFGRGKYLHWTNVLLVPSDLDIRSGYDSQFNTFNPAKADTVMVKDYPIIGHCTAFMVVLVQRQRTTGGAADYKRVYLDRALPSDSPCPTCGCPGMCMCLGYSPPSLLHATLGSSAVVCPCLNGVVVPLNWNPVDCKWVGDANLPLCAPGTQLRLKLWCQPGGMATQATDFRLDYEGCVTVLGEHAGFASTCMPFNLYFGQTSTPACCGTSTPPNGFTVQVTL